MKEELRSIGLTDGEIEVYLALLRLGPSTNSPIARSAHLQSSTVYYCLNSLIEKGFATYILKGQRRYFSAVNPRVIPSIIDGKIEELNQDKAKVEGIISALSDLQDQSTQITTAEVHEGFRSFQHLFSHILDELKRGDCYEAFVIEQEIAEPKEIRLLFMRHNKALKAKGIKLRLLAPEAMRPVFSRMYGTPFLKTFQEIRFTKERTPVGITIYTDHVVTHVSENDAPISFEIRNRKLAQMYRDYFYDVWERAKL